LVNKKVAFINGISGQDGAYLAEYLLSKDYHVIGITRQAPTAHIMGLEYLGIRNQLDILNADISDALQCRELLEKYSAHEFYNLAAQSSVSYSFEKPVETVQYNILSVLHLLETIRKVNPELKFYQASSSEMYGKIDRLPIRKSDAFHPVSPYGISKATGHWLVNQYREAYGLFAASGVLFNHESYLRPETFFVKKVIRSAIKIKNGLQKNLIVGNLDLKRDFGYAKEYIKAIWLILQSDKPADLHVCSGRSVSLRDIVYYVFDHYGLDTDLIIQDKSLYRPAEIEDIYGDNSDIKALGWKYDYTFFDVLDILIDEEERNFKIP